MQKSLRTGSSKEELSIVAVEVVVEEAVNSRRSSKDIVGGPGAANGCIFLKSRSGGQAWASQEGGE